MSRKTINLVGPEGAYANIDLDAIHEIEPRVRGSAIVTSAGIFEVDAKEEDLRLLIEILRKEEDDGNAGVGSIVRPTPPSLTAQNK